jgi:hypothetical protein
MFISTIAILLPVILPLTVILGTVFVFITTGAITGGISNPFEGIDLSP